MKTANGNDNGQKGKGLYSQNNNVARASRFIVHIFVVVARSFVEDGNTQQQVSFSFLNFDTVL